jgi:type VI secretion system protein ImpJ
MTTLSALPDEILWEEGMLLAPQHFQQAALRQQDELRYHLALAAPYHWGLREAVHDPHLLSAGTYRLLRMQAVMPDGLAVHRAPGVDLEVDLRPLENRARVAPVRVWLSVPARREPGEPFAGNLARMVPLEGFPVPDENTGEGTLSVRRQRPVLVLQAGDRPGAQYVSLPVAEVVLQDDRFILTDYVPPLLEAGPDSAPAAWCLEVARRTRLKAVALAERAADSPTTHATIRFLAAGLPPLEALLATGRTHPFALYHALCAMAGWLSGAVAATVPPAFRAYDHEELRASFAPLRDFAAEVLSRVTDTLRAVPFEAMESRFELGLRPAWAETGELLVGILAHPGSEAEAAAWMESARIATESRVESLRHRRIPGARRERVRDAGPLGLVPGKMEVLYRVWADPEFILPGERLVVANPGDPSGSTRPPRAVLYTRHES